MIALDIFTPFYDLIGVEPTGLDYQDAFDGAGLITIILSILMSLAFYLLLGRLKKPIWFKLWHWLVTLGLNSALCMFIAYLQAENYVSGFQWSFYVVKFMIINLVGGDAIFFITSIIVKRWSIYSKYVPF